MQAAGAVRALVALAVAAAIAAPAVAQAETMSFSPAGAISSAGRLTFHVGTTNVACNVTFRGVLETGAIAMARSELFGAMSEVAARECSGGSIGRATGRAWPLLYTGFIVSNEWLQGWEFEVEGFTLQVSLFNGFIQCLYGGDLEGMVATEEWLPRYTTALLDWEPGVALRLVSGAGCPSTMTVSGGASFTSQTVTVR